MTFDEWIVTPESGALLDGLEKSAPAGYESIRAIMVLRRAFNAGAASEGTKSGGEISPRVARHLLAARDALASQDISEAYHQLYTIADPGGERSYLDGSGGPWAKLEAVANSESKPNSEPMDNGPWRVNDVGNVESDDFTHDVTLQISGDFEDRDNRFAYARELCGRLNRSYPHFKPGVDFNADCPTPGGCGLRGCRGLCKPPSEDTLR